MSEPSTERGNGPDHRCGSTLITAVVLLCIAGITIGSILTATMVYTRQARADSRRQKAAFLADAGLRAALVRLNALSSGTIALNQSRNYFASTNGFETADWGFTTGIVVTNGQNMVQSIGRCDGSEVEVTALVTLGSGSRSIHALYAHALYSGNRDGNTNYTLSIGGTGSGADFVAGDTYSGNDIVVSGDASLRMPELLYDLDGDKVHDPTVETWEESYITQTFTNALTQTAYDTYESAMQPYMDQTYGNGEYDLGEAYVDTIGNGIYDLGEPFEDTDGNGVRHPGDEYTDLNGNGVWDAGEPFEDLGNGVYDAGEEWTDDPSNANRQNGRYDGPDGYWEEQEVGGYWEWYRRGWRWRRRWVPTYDWVWVSEPGAPGEEFEDTGDGVFYAGEPYTDQNGVYDEGEEYLDDRNGEYDYGTQAAGTITGMPSPGPGQQAATGGDSAIAPPDLQHMYYNVDRNATKPDDALARWGHDVAVTASDYGGEIAINDSSYPEHIFLRNPPNSGSSYVWSDGAKIYKRTYTPIYDDVGARVDDYFLEDPSDSTFNSNPSENRIAQNDSSRTCTMFIDVKSQGNSKLYYVDGNVYIHSPRAYSMRFREPGTRITVVARGNITISDEFYYNADYPDNLQYADMDSTVVEDPSDALCLIALKNPSCTNNSGNILIGDRQFGTGGSIHAMLYAENDFVDNNLNTVDQQFISVFGNMTAGNEVSINRQTGGGHYRTRLDVSLDQRIRDGNIIVPGLPHPVGSERSIELDTAWHMVPGSWSSWSMLQ